MWSAFLHMSAHRVEDGGGVSSERGRMCCGATETLLIGRRLWQQEAPRSYGVVKSSLGSLAPTDVTNHISEKENGSMFNPKHSGKWGNAITHARTHTHSHMHTRTHAHTHTHTHIHAHTHAHALAHTHTQCHSHSYINSIQVLLID